MELEMLRDIRDELRLIRLALESQSGVSVAFQHKTALRDAERSLAECRDWYDWLAAQRAARKTANSMAPAESEMSAV